MQTNFDLPATLEAGNGTAQGCRVVDWNGHQATMICFVVNGEHMDLFVMDSTGLPNLRENGTPQFASVDGLMTAMWVGGGKVYLLTGKNEPVLQSILTHEDPALIQPPRGAARKAT